MAAEPSNTMSLVKRSTDTQLMTPPSKRIKRPQKVLDEDAYVSAVSEIIARDFFPGLLESETQQEYLDALDSKDQVWISNASRRLHQVMTPGRKRGRRGTSLHTPRARPLETPRGDYVGDTPVSVVSEMSITSTQAAAKVEADTNMSLSAFQAKYTSEDNESFYKLLDGQNEKRAEKYAWMWTGNKMPSKMMIKQKEIETKLIENGRALHDDGGKKDRLAIKASGEKPARPDGWESKPRNQFMFLPDSVEDSVQTVAQKAQEDSRAAPMGVNYANTRLPVAKIAPEAPGSPSLSAIQDAIAGRPRLQSETDYGGSETPRVNGYAFVDDEPEEYIPPPIQIELPKADTMPNPFKIKERSAREDLLHRVVDRNARSKRASSQNGMTGRIERTPIARFPSSPRVGSGSLTPAAQRLWSKVGKTTGLGSPSKSSVRTPILTKQSGSGTGLKVGWTAK